MEQHFSQVDWVDVYERVPHAALRVFAAAGMAGADQVLASYGVGPEDMAGEVVLALMDPANEKVVWNTAIRGTPTTLTVVEFLVAVLRHDFQDKVRAKRRKRQDALTAPAEDGTIGLRVDPADRSPDAERQLVSKSLRKRLDDDFLARPDDELQLYMMLQFDDGLPVPYPPREAADHLEIPVERVYLLKERLERRLLRLYRDELHTLHPYDTEKRRYEQEAR